MNYDGQGLPVPQTPHRAGVLRGVLAFIFTQDFSQVLLIFKNRPAWAAGKFNGIGGKHEADETDQDCITRETREETGLKIAPEKWTTVAHIEWGDWDGAVVATVWEGKTDEAKSVTDEPVSWHPVKNLPDTCMSNLHWLIPMAIDVLQEKQGGDYGARTLYAQVKYQPLFE